MPTDQASSDLMVARDMEPPPARRVLVIGSGLAAYGCCLALLETKAIEVTVFDIGLTEPYADQPNQPVPNAIDYHGSFFAYGVNDRRWSVSTCTKRLCSSHAMGGYSKVYSGSILKPRDSDLVGWPPESIPSIYHYNSIVSSLRLWQQRDELEHAFSCFPFIQDSATNEATLVGSPRVALDQDIDGQRPFDCSHAFQHWAQLGKIRYMAGVYVTALEVLGHGITAHVDGAYATGNLRFDCVYIAAGCINTTGIVDRSVWGLGTRTYQLKLAPTLLQLHLKLWWHRSNRAATHSQLQTLPADLCKAFLEHRSTATLGLWCHTQINSFNRTILQTIRTKLPIGLRELFLAIQPLFRFSITVFHSNLGVTASLISCCSAAHGQILQTLELIEPPDQTPSKLAATVRHAILRKFSSLGLLPIPFGSLISQIMKGNTLGGWHYGGSLPMVRNPTSPTQLFPSGELSSMPGVYVIDASGFPSVPGSTVALLTMANAYRIGSMSCQQIGETRG